MSDDLLMFETRLNKEQLQYLLQFVENGQLHARNPEFALGVFLSRPSPEYTYSELALRWGITRQTASTYCDQIRQILSKSFYNEYLSLGSDRHKLISHQTKIARQLYAPSGDHIIIVLEGTYIFIQKSNNFSFRRDTHSGHKKRNLITK